MNRSVATAHLFRPLAAELVRLLRGLGTDAWDRRTSAPAWTVRDVVAHLLDGDLRRLSNTRDGHFLPPPDPPLRTSEDLVAYLDRLNEQWIRAAQRLSPGVLIDLLEASGRSVADLVEALDPAAAATFPVAWAGQTASPMWLDIGREYTERWHHQDQIREAVGAPPLREPEWLRPVLDVSVLALPHAYRDVAAPEGTRVSLHISGDAGGDWHLVSAQGWELRPGRGTGAACSVAVADLDFARLLLHRLSVQEARSAVQVTGRAELAVPLLKARAVMVQIPS